jgi:hypothetical protein
MRKVAFGILAAAGSLVPLTGPAHADARQDVVNQLARCAVLNDDRQWLDCYYGAAQPLRSQLGLSPAPQANMPVLRSPQISSIPTRVAPAAYAAPVAAPRSGPPPMPRRGGLLDVFGGDTVVHSVPVRSVQRGGDGFTITLVDGQVWEQTPADNGKPLSWNGSTEDMRVTVAQGAMHTFNLTVDGDKTHYKVKRVR